MSVHWDPRTVDSHKKELIVAGRYLEVDAPLPRPPLRHKHRGLLAQQKRTFVKQDTGLERPSVSVQENGVAILYDGYKATEAAAGPGQFLDLFVERCMVEHGSGVRVYGVNKIAAMRAAEREAQHDS